MIVRLNVQHHYVKNEKLPKKKLNLYTPTLISTLVDDLYLLNAITNILWRNHLVFYALCISKQESFTEYPWEYLVPLRMHQKNSQKFYKDPGI